MLFLIVNKSTVKSICENVFKKENSPTYPTFK